VDDAPAERRNSISDRRLPTMQTITRRTFTDRPRVERRACGRKRICSAPKRRPPSQRTSDN
jgi:hypothetical protein